MRAVWLSLCSVPSGGFILLRQIQHPASGETWSAAELFQQGVKFSHHLPCSFFCVIVQVAQLQKASDFKRLKGVKLPKTASCREVNIKKRQSNTPVKNLDVL